MTFQVQERGSDAGKDFDIDGIEFLLEELAKDGYPEIGGERMGGQQWCRNRYTGAHGATCRKSDQGKAKRLAVKSTQPVNMPAGSATAYGKVMPKSTFIIAIIA